MRPAMMYAAGFRHKHFSTLWLESLEGRLLLTSFQDDTPFSFSATTVGAPSAPPLTAPVSVSVSNSKDSNGNPQTFFYGVEGQFTVATATAVDYGGLVTIPSNAAAPSQINIEILTYSAGVPYNQGTYVDSTNLNTGSNEQTVQSPVLAPGQYTALVEAESSVSLAEANVDLSVAAAMPAPTPGTIGGIVYNDKNGDGAKERKEPGLSGFTVTLQQLKHGKPVGRSSSTTSNSSGNYSFSNLATGSYKVSEAAPRGGRLTQPSSGYYLLSVTSGANFSGENFGNAPATKSAAIKFSSTPITTPPVAPIAVDALGLFNEHDLGVLE